MCHANMTLDQKLERIKKRIKETNDTYGYSKTSLDIHMHNSHIVNQTWQCQCQKNTKGDTRSVLSHLSTVHKVLFVVGSNEPPSKAPPMTMSHPTKLPAWTMSLPTKLPAWVMSFPTKLELR